MGNAIRVTVHLGSGMKGEERLRRLNQLALRLGFTFDEEPSLGRMLQAIADGEYKIVEDNSEN